LRKNPESNSTKFHFPRIFSVALPKTVTASIIVNRFRSCGIFQWNPDATPEKMFEQSEAFGANWKLHPGLENIVPVATEDQVCPIPV
jgi:hypothetical protein